jgi:2-methylisocitrate lyase-like PEP mutase family enzyme
LVIVSGLDQVFEIAARALPAAGVECLLIGGFAVNHFGYTRGTLDVDFMIVSDRLEDVRRIMREAGFLNSEQMEALRHP